MNAKIDVVRLANEDVIATSCQCQKYDLLYYMSVQYELVEENYEVYVNNSSIHKNKDQYSVDNLHDYGEGWYHVSNGHIVGICDCADDQQKMIQSHGLLLHE